MYSIYADDLCIYNDLLQEDTLRVINPKLSVSDNSAGSLTITLPTTNVGYNTIVRMVTDIVVKKNGSEIWAGRVLSEEKDFWNNRILTCEGELAFFNDSTQPPAEYHNLTVRGFLEQLVSIHNSKVASNRAFTVGAVTVTDPNDSLYRYTNYEKTIECINEKLIDRLGGHLRVRKENGIRYLDYLADYPNTNSQKIEFGKNLLDFTRRWDLTDFATVIVPLGARLDESPIDALEAYLTVADVNDGSIYVISEDAVASYGWIEKVVRWDDVTTASALLSKAQRYLSELQFDDMHIELNAVDLHYLDINVESVNLLDEIEVVSVPHGMDRLFPVSKLDIPLDNPDETTFILGDKVRTSLTKVNNATNADILNKIENIPKVDEEGLLAQARANATEIMNMATNGYITITQDEYGTNTLYISNTRNYTNATRIWKWSLNGLGYSDDGGETYKLALTMDGSIVGTFINFIGAVIGGWNISSSAIYKDVKGNDGYVYRVYFQPPLFSGVKTWVLSCQKSKTQGNVGDTMSFTGVFVLYSDGSAMFGRGSTTIDTDGNITANSITTNSGKIGPWVISESGLTYGDGDEIEFCALYPGQGSTLLDLTIIRSLTADQASIPTLNVEDAITGSGYITMDGRITSKKQIVAGGTSFYDDSAAVIWGKMRVAGDIVRMASSGSGYYIYQVLDSNNYGSYVNINNLLGTLSYTKLSDRPTIPSDAINSSGGDSGNGYIKFRNKIQICWRKISVTTAISGAWGGIYDAGAFDLGNWYTSFGATPAVSYGLEADNHGAFIECYGSPSSTSAGSVYLARGSKDTTSRSYTIYVIGVGVGT